MLASKTYRLKPIGLLQRLIAAQVRDFESIRNLMKADFIWNFSGDASATQAIVEWKANPAMLNQLISL